MSTYFNLNEQVGSYLSLIVVYIKVVLQELIIYNELKIIINNHKDMDSCLVHRT